MRARSIALAAAGIVCLIAGPVAAQTKWSGGIKGGVSLAKIGGDTGFSDSFTDGVDVIDLFGDVGDTRTGFIGGGFVTADVNEKFGFRVELLYAQKGGAGTLNVNLNGVPAGTADLTFKLDYFEVPVLLVGTIPTQGSTKLSVFGGPTIAFNTGSKLKFDVQGQANEQDIGDTVESTDFGLALGAGVSFPASARARIVIDGRYTLGFSKFPNTGEDLKNRDIVFMAGFSFPLGGGSGGQ
jgi:opacity protein-like surface antigen